MRRIIIAVVLLLLAGMATAEPKQVDSDWQRSDDAPIDIATPAEEEQQADGMVWLLYGACGIGGLMVIMGLCIWRVRR